MKCEFFLGGRVALLLAGMVAATCVATSQAQAQQQDVEKCYGITAAGQDDGRADGPNAEVPGTSKVDYDGQAFKYVRKGTCETIRTPKGKGSLTPIKN